ncbi:unnamed protein product [Arabidopsis lyrata]|uniref:Uncharacterized protein n=1 Tax=Arabidopsis lyrata subsp. lyrata TaxID=81972 RepID=D7LMZ2_ARALL|nr:uncharacterized protein LOC9311846 [Arabidopsis lyrata subsp. lyrata]EFH53738.1 hypothetical protein ARALYDRAFT_905826 [Arabidopsis lyrata subsp. lyrata]CAH8267629.1 unnamed protein product [Arabidopsis lyrata]|eukprot:XP_020880171.1 uncharacterized protein LOC9311846 [Arabidopsis lyrata subsp. lyrata]
MASKCIDACVNIKIDSICIRPVMTYANLYKWPMAEAEFVRSISNDGSQRRTTVVDSISCRQMYLRSYTFSTKENEEDNDRGSGEAADRRNKQSCFRGGGGRKKAAKKATRKNQTSSCRAFVLGLVWKCLSCASTTKVTNID